MKLLIINPGATSTKVAVFENDQELSRVNIDHPAETLAPFKRIIDQKEYRLGLILKWLDDNGYPLSDFAAVCGRGGLLRHIPSGTYEVTDKAIQDVLDPPYGEHASNLGVAIAREIGDMAKIKAYFVDPVSVDEMTEIAHVSGFCGMQRESFFHALNQKSVGRKAAGMLKKPYDKVNLIVVHMGGGVSVAAHEHGRVVDVYNVKDEGSFAMDRGGSLPVNAVINLCFSGLTKAEVKRRLGSEAGVYSYLGTRDFREVERRKNEGDAEAALIFNALAYQHAKDIGAMAAVLKYDIDAVVFTGGMANSRALVNAICEYTGKLAPALTIPGEEEMQSLAMGALRALTGESPAKLY